MTDARSLSVELRAGQEISFDNGRFVVRLTEKTGKVAQLRVTAPADVEIKRPSQPAAVPSGAAQARNGIIP